MLNLNVLPKTFIKQKLALTYIKQILVLINFYTKLSSFLNMY